MSPGCKHGCVSHCQDCNEDEIATLRAKLAAAEEARELIEKELRGERISEFEFHTSIILRVVAERDEAAAMITKLIRMHEETATKRNVYAEERDQARAEVERLTRERDEARKWSAEFDKRVNRAEAERDDARTIAAAQGEQALVMSAEIARLSASLRLAVEALDKVLFVVSPNPLRADDVPHSHCRCAPAVSDIARTALASVVEKEKP